MKPFGLVTRCHKYRIVNRCAELDSTYADRRDERQRLTEIVGKSEVYEYRKFDDRYKNERQRNALFNKGDDDEYSHDGNGVDNFEVSVRCLYHVFHAGRFAYQHSFLVVLFKHGVKFVYLGVYVVGRNFVFGVDKQKFPLVALQNALYAVGNDFFRHSRTYNRFKTENIFDAVNLFHFFHHILNGFLVKVCVNKNHVRGSDIEVVGKFRVRYNVFDIVRQALSHIVVNFIVGFAVTVISRRNENREYNKEYGEYFC